MPKTFFDTLTTNAAQAAYRVAGAQIIKASKNSLLRVLRRKGINNKHVNKVSDFLDTETGTAGLSTVVGLALAYLPSYRDNKRAQGIAREFGVGGAALTGNLLTSRAMKAVLPKLGDLIEVFPIPKIPLLSSPPKMRVAELSTILASNEEIEEDTVSNSSTSYAGQFR